MKLEYKAGNFLVNTYTDGYPMWIEVQYEDKRIRFHHKELKDLQYCIERMINNVKAKLPDGNKHEVT